MKMPPAGSLPAGGAFVTEPALGFPFHLMRVTWIPTDCFIGDVCTSKSALSPFRQIDSTGQAQAGQVRMKKPRPAGPPIPGNSFWTSAARPRPCPIPRSSAQTGAGIPRALPGARREATVGSASGRAACAGRPVDGRRGIQHKRTGREFSSLPRPNNSPTNGRRRLTTGA
jgi:hypothetical protein